MTTIPATFRALIAAAVVATLLPLGPSVVVAAPSPAPSSMASSTAEMCPADHVIPTAVATPEASPLATAGRTPEPTPEAAAHSSPSRGLKEPPPAPLTNLGGSWPKLPRSPFAAVSAMAVWAGARMVAIDPASGRTATYTPSIRQWEEHQPIPSGSMTSGPDFDGIPRAARTGDEVILAGHLNTPDGATQVRLAFDPGTGRWRTLATSPLDRTGELAWTGELLIEVTADRHAAAYDPAADCWIDMPDVPLPELPANDRTMRAMEWSPNQLVWMGDQLLAIVHNEDPEFGLGVVAFDPRTWTWDPGPQGPLSSQLASAILIDGRLLFMDRRPNDRWLGNGTYDPATETWTVDDTGCRLRADSAVWTGRLILEPYAHRAYDPATGQCYRVPKVKDRARYVRAPVWTGHEYIVWSGSWGDSSIPYPDGLIYRPPRKALTGELAKPVGKKLQGAITTRREWGFETDPDVVREIMRDPYQPGSREHGFPMTEAEQRDLWTRASFVGRASEAKRWLRKQPLFGGIWLDQRTGGDIVVALTEADPDLITDIDRHFTPYGETPWRLVIVPRTLDELRSAFRQARKVSREIDPTATLWSVGLDESAGRISLMYDPDDVGRMRARKKELEKALGVPVHITSGRIRLDQ